VPHRKPPPESQSAEALRDRIRTLLAAVAATEAGEQDILEVFDTPLRGKPVLCRREVRIRVNRPAAVAYWREIRATEDKLEALLATEEGVQAISDTEVTIKFDGPKAPPAE